MLIGPPSDLLRSNISAMLCLKLETSAVLLQHRSANHSNHADSGGPVVCLTASSYELIGRSVWGVLGAPVAMQLVTQGVTDE